MKNVKNNVLVVFACLLSLIFVGCAAQMKSGETKSPQVAVLPVNSNKIKFEQATPPAAPTKSDEPAKSDEPILAENADDGATDAMIKRGKDDEDCFIAAAKTCQPASFTNYESVDLGDSVLSKTDYYEIRGGSADECKLYTKVLSWTAKPVEISEQEKKRKEKEFIEKGWTVKELTEAEKKDREEMRLAMEKRMSDAVGTGGICTFTTTKLVALLKRWKAGSFSSGDYKGAQCKGTYFTEANGFTKDF